MITTFEPIPLPLTIEPSGVIRVAGTRVALDTIYHRFHQGLTPQEIAANFPHISLADVLAVLTYCERRPQEVSSYLQEQEIAAKASQLSVPAEYNGEDLKRRIVVRKLTSEGARNVEVAG